MINFFRKIRRKLASENKFQKYFRYAFGEVVLIMLGIFMALQLNNWNERRKMKVQFRVTLQQVYNDIKFDIDYFESQKSNLDYQISMIEILINAPHKIPARELPATLHPLNFARASVYRSEANFLVPNLRINPENPLANEIAGQALSYIKSIEIHNNEVDDALNKYLRKADIPFPDFDLNKLEWRLTKADSTYYSNSQIARVKAMSETETFKSILKTLRIQKIVERVKTHNFILDGHSVMDLIKQYDPKIHLIYEYVGIIGTSIDGYDDEGFKPSTPMRQIEINNNIYEIDLYLKEGTVKFRCRDSWAQNWGGTTFPKGDTFYDGPNIPVNDGGNYHIILDLNKNTYEFIKLDQ